MLRRKHRTMTKEQQQDLGAAVRERGGAPRYAQRAGSGDRSGLDGRAQPNESGFAARDSRAAQEPQAHPRVQHRRATSADSPTYSQVNDSERYRQMRRQRAGEMGPAQGGGLRINKGLVLKVAGGALALMLVAVLGFAFTVTGRMNAGLDSSVRSELSVALPGQPFYMLLVGTDKSAEREETGATGGTYRTDSIMLARVDPLAAKVTLVSIQRDTLVDLGEYGQQKINAAYTFGGGSLLVKTVSELAGVPISHYAEIDFDSFTQVVDALGGIEVNVPIDLDDDLADLHVSAGVQTIDGATALGLCRARHAYDSYGAGDYFRTANQRMVLGAILKKALSGNPASLLATIDSASNSVSTDLTGIDFLLLGLRFLGFDMEKDLYSGLEPTNSQLINGTWYELLDTTSWQAMMSRVDRGLSPYSDASQDPTAGLAGSTTAISN